MKQFLIITMPHDAHAVIVKLALERIGHQCKLWYLSDIPTLQTHSFEIDRDVKWNASGLNFYSNNHTFDLIWNRRFRTPRLDNSLHEDDKKNAMLENLAFHQSIAYYLSIQSRWVNDLDVGRKANSKVMQLKVAIDCELKVPKSLFSNDPVRIREFFNNNKDSDIIYKTQNQLSWFEHEGVRLIYTNVIESDQLPSDCILRNVPGIYQVKIQKNYEVRVTFFDTEYLAIKIYSQKNKNGLNDWRQIPQDQMQIERFNLPTDIYNKCIKFMRKLGLKFACFDFIVTPGNEYVFLEVNEQGQFLWIEELDPSIPMLNSFVNFLLKQVDLRSGNFKPLRLSDFESEASSIISKAILVHVDPDRVAV